MNKSADSSMSTIRIEADDLRQACQKLMSLYRSATILEDQEGNGEVKKFEPSDIRFQSHPIDPDIFSMNHLISNSEFV